MKSLNQKWHVVRDEALNTWAICNTDLPLPKQKTDNGDVLIALCMDELTAKAITTAHNDQLASRHDLPHWVYPIDSMIDVIVQGEHRYWSTHCRHATEQDNPDLHMRCSSDVITGLHPSGLVTCLFNANPHELDDECQDVVSYASAVLRKPAQCKHCAAPCLCRCHNQAG